MILAFRGLSGGVFGITWTVLEGSPSQFGSEFPLGALLGPRLEPTWAILASSWAPLKPT